MDDRQEARDLDLSRIATTAADWMEGLERGIREAMEDKNDVPTVRTVAMIVELDWPASDANGGHGSTAIKYTCTDARVWIQKALFAEASDIADRGREPVDEP